MTWTAWRLTRPTALGAAVVVTVAVVYLVLTGHALTSSFADAGLPACLTSGMESQACLDARFDFYELTRSLTGGQAFVGFLGLLPGFLGAFVGAPVVAREIERGTLRLAWTQAVTRTRWLAARWLIALAVVVVLVVALVAALTYWRGPLDLLGGRIEPNAYSIEGVVPLGYAVLTFCLALTAGLVLRRLVPALAVGIVGFLVVRVVVETTLRPRFLTPITVSYVDQEPTGLAAQLDGAWVLERRVPRTGSGFPDVVVFHPADRFWTFQLMELGVLLALSAALVAVAFVWVRRRARP